MAGAGALPGRAAREARRQGWHVTGFVFDEAPGLAETAHRLVPSRLTDIAAVIEALRAHRVEAVAFVGSLAKQAAFAGAAGTDAAGRHLADRGLSDSALGQTAARLLEGMGIAVLDPRGFLEPWLLTAPTLTSRRPTESEWEEIRAGLAVARLVAAAGIGQTVVRARGVTVAVEAAEGTDETIRRGTRLAGPGAVVVKTVAAGHDFRFDVPAIGPATLRAMAEGGAAALAVPRGQVLLLEEDEARRIAVEAGIAVVTVGHDA